MYRSITIKRSLVLIVTVSLLAMLVGSPGPAEAIDSTAEPVNNHYVRDDTRSDDAPPQSDDAPPQSDDAPPQSDDAPPQPPSKRSARPEYDVLLAVGDDFQQVVGANPPGTTYLVQSGVHREQQVVPHDGDTFIGENGAVLSGARDLTNATWIASSGRWYVEGQDQEGFVHGTLIDGGNQRHARPEELFVNGQRWDPVVSVADLGPGTWHLDYGADRIYLGVDPATLGTIEASTTSGAFGGTGVKNVTIQNLTVTQYATPAQHGAIGFFGQHHTHDWTVRDVTVVNNHGAGIRLGPGMTVEGSEISHNGQIGLAGDGVDTSGGPTDGFAAPVTLRGNNIHHNKVLDYDWAWEGGAMKIKWTPVGSRVEGNWVHDNYGPGIWYDIDNYDATIIANLVEDNDQAGIFYEISYGTTLVADNAVRGNGFAGVGDEGAGIDISNSRDVTVSGNTVRGNRRGILVRDDKRDPGLNHVVVTDNDIEIGDSNWTVKSRGVDPGEVGFKGNRYYGDDRDAFRVDTQALDLDGWLALGVGVDERLFDDNLMNRDGATPSTDGYGAR